MIVEKIAPLLKTLAAGKDPKLAYVNELMAEANRLAKITNPRQPALNDVVMAQAIRNYVPRLQMAITALQAKNKNVTVERAALTLIQQLMPAMASDTMLIKSATDAITLLRKTVKGLNAKTGTDLVLAALDRQFGISLDKTRALVIIKQIFG